MTDQRAVLCFLIGGACLLLPDRAFPGPPVGGPAQAAARRPETSQEQSGQRPPRGTKVEVGRGYVLFNSEPPPKTAPATTLTRQERIDNFETLADAIGKYFALFELKGIRNWTEIVASYRQRLDKPRSADEYYLLLYQFVNELHDSHSWLENWLPTALNFSPHLHIEPYGERAMVTAVPAGSEAEQKGVEVGCEILKIDDASVEARLRQIDPYLKRLSTPWAMKRRAFASLLSGPEGTTVEVQFQSSQHRVYQISLSRFRGGRWSPPPSERQYAFAVEKLKFVHYGIHPSRMGYIYIPSFGTQISTAAIADDFDVALEALRKTPGLIVDVRGNGGGSGAAHLRMVGRLVSQPTVVAISHGKSPAAPDTLWRHAIEVSPAGTWQYHNPVALLMNEDTGSAADLFACYMRNTGRVVSVGSTTHGNLPGTQCYAVLPCNLVVRISCGFVCDPHDLPIEGHGNVPDVVVQRTIPDLVAGRDAALEKAVKILQETPAQASRDAAQITAHPPAAPPRGELPQDAKLSPGLRLCRDQEEQTFRAALDPARWQVLGPQEKAAEETKRLGQLVGGDAPERLEAVNALAALGSKQAVPGLLQIATKLQENNRARWMAVRALGIIGDVRAVPPLVHLTYHYNSNTRFWARISLMRLTGQDFGPDVAAWKSWWEKQGGEPPISRQTTAWTTNAEWADPEKQLQSDRRHVEMLTDQRAQGRDAGADGGRAKAEQAGQDAPAPPACDPSTGVCRLPIPQGPGSFTTALNRRRHGAENTEVLPLEFTLADAYGREVRAADYRGTAVLMLAGACWCGGCMDDTAILRRVEQKYRARGLQTVRCTVWDNELPAWEYQKHFRLPSVPLQDPIRQFEKHYNRDGWTFLILADPAGRVVYRANDPIDWFGVEARLDAMLPLRSPVTPVERDGTSYLPVVLERSGETATARRRDVYPSLACAADGRAYVAFTSNRHGTQDVYLRVFDGQKWLPDRPVAATAADEFDGAVIVDRNNRPWVSWTSNARGSHYNIFVASPAGPSSAIDAMQVTNSDDDVMHARMAVDSQKRIWVTYGMWAKIQGGKSRAKQLYARYFQADRWSKEIHVNPEDIPDYEKHFDPVLAAQGDAVVCGWSWDFHQPNPGYSSVPREPSIFLRKIGPGGPVGRARAVSGSNVDTRPTLAVAADGRVWCAWESAVNPGRGKTISFSIEDLGRPEHPGVGADITGLQENICSPCLAMSPRGAVSLVWAEADTQGQWALKQAAWDANRNAWAHPRTLVAQGHPRFPSAAYAQDGTLWVAYSVEKEDRREIEVLVVRNVFEQDVSGQSLYQKLRSTTSCAAAGPLAGAGEQGGER